jgi:hypothetical protein
MWRRVAPVGTDVWEERIASIISVTRISGLETLAVTSNRSTQRLNVGSYMSHTALDHRGPHSSNEITIYTKLEMIRPDDAMAFLNVFSR